MGECTSCLEVDKGIVIQPEFRRDQELNTQVISIEKNEDEIFEEKYENVVHPNETRMERYKRKTKEFFEDLKERAINNYEHIKARFGKNNQNQNEEVNNQNQNEQIIILEKTE